MALYFLRSLLGMELELESNTNNQGLDQLCSSLKEIYQYWDEIGIRMRRRTVSLQMWSKRDKPFRNPGKTTLCHRKEVS